MKKNINIIFVFLALILTLSTCKDDDDPVIVSTASVIEDFYQGLGGQSNLEGLNSYGFNYTATTTLGHQGPTTTSQSHEVINFTSSLSFDFSANLLMDNQAITHEIFGFPGELGGRLIIDFNNNIGYTEDLIDIFAGPVGAADISSAKVAAIERFNTIKSPHYIAKNIIAGNLTATYSETTSLNGANHNVLSIMDGGIELLLYINEITNELTQISTLDNSFLYGDMRTIFEFSSWENVNSLAIPKNITVKNETGTIYSEMRSGIMINQSGVTMPNGINLAGLTQSSFDIGFKNMMYSIQQAALTGEPLNAFDGDAPNTVQIDTDTYFLQFGGDYNMTIVNQDNGIVVIESSLYEARIDVVASWINATFPGKSIIYTIPTHHHEDHSGGVRTLAAKGATVVVSENVSAFYETLLSNNATVSPDELSMSSVSPQVVSTTNGVYTIADSTNPVEVYEIVSNHAESLVLIYLPTQQMVQISGDLYAPGDNPDDLPFMGDENALLIYNTIINNGLTVQTIYGSHGGFSSDNAWVSFADFENALN